MKELAEAIRDLTTVLREMVEESRRNRELVTQDKVPDAIGQLTELIKGLRIGR